MDADPPASFRDPSPADERAAALLAEIARDLLGAPALPAPLPSGGLSLLELRADGRWLDLVVGPSDPVARVRLRGGRADEVARLDPRAARVARRHPRAAQIEARVEPLHEDAARFGPALEALAARLEVRLEATRWARTEARLRTIAALPRGIPLSYLRQLIEGVAPRRGLVRTGFGCNQDCGLCWQGRGWGGADAAQVRVWIEDLARSGAVGLTISGGEPTLDPALADHIRHAKALGIGDVVLETNAILCARPGRAAALVEAGLDTAFVSLHSPDAEVSDRITASPGTFERTVRGIDALLAAGAEVVLNAVMTSEAIATLPDLPGFVRARFGARGPRAIVLSYPTRPFDDARFDALVPEPEPLRDALRATLAAARAHGVRLEGLDGPCGPPLCAFDADPWVTDRAPVEPVHFRVHVPACDTCEVRRACFGVRPETVARFGARAVRPINER
ncbi:MAG: radical SAM protein [Sandaracinaceae bacterium]|nr:radical SAM protein [Sandaracinaceae bacterium]